MKIEAFLKNMKYSKKLIQLGGFEYLISRWENIVKNIPYDDHYQFDDYLNELYSRETIQDIQENCIVCIDNLDRINRTDSLFKTKTIKVNSLLSNKAKNNVSIYWFYYRVPPDRIPNWFNEKSVEMEIWNKWRKTQS
jgi:hypothetical protein